MNDKINNKMFFWIKRKKRIIIGLATITIIILMFFIIDLKTIFSNVIRFGLLGILIFIVAYSFTFFLRSLKLKLIFKGLGLNISYTNSYYSCGVSFVINESTPTKIGDVIKIGIIKDQENITLSESLCGIAIERVLDLLILFSFSCVALIYLYFSNFNKNQTNTILGSSLKFYITIGALMLVIILLFLIILIFKTDLMIKIIYKITPYFANILKNFIINFKEGIKNFKNNKKELGIVIFIQILLWIVEVFIGIIFFLLLFQEKYHLNLLIIILALIITYFSKAMPITPGGWGISENLGALFIFIFYPNIPFTLILSIFVIEHLFRSSYIFIYGGISMFHYNFRLRELESARIDFT